MPETKWLLYAENAPAPLCRKPGGSYMAEDDTGDQVIRGAWVRILKLAGVRYRNPYQTRHTFASMMLSAGEHPMWVAKQMGHKDWTMIGRIYGRWMPHANPNAGAQAVELFASKSRGNGTADGDQVVTEGVCKRED